MPDMTNPTIKSLLDNIERAAVAELKVHPRNPRRGDVDRIAASLEANGQYRPIVVQSSTGYIIAGNHTYLGARKLGWTHLDIVRIDVNDKKARKIMLADNRTSDAGDYDRDILAEVIASLDGDTEGSGYYDDEIEAMLSGVAQQAEETMGEFEDTELQRRFNDAPLGEEGDALTEEGELTRGGSDGGEYELAGADEEDDSLEAAADVLPGLKTLKNPDEVTFPKVGYWQLPEIDTSMLMRFDELPEKLVTWGESYSRQGQDPAANDPDTWWFFPWGMSSTSGMKDTSKVIPAFYSPDNVFEQFWWYPERYAAKFINSKIQFMCGFDYSMVGDAAPAMWMYQLYRQRWCSRYFQEAGIKLIPNVSGPVTDLEFSRKYVLGTLPKNLPMIAFQHQTFNKEDVEILGLDQYVKHHQQYIDVLEPQAVLVYAGNPGQEMLKEHVDFRGAQVRYIDSRLKRLNDLDKMFPKSRAMKKGI